MKATTKRGLFRWVHLVSGVPVVGYVYSPFDAIPDFAWVVRYIFMPVLLLSGLWMWKGHVLKRLLSNHAV